jgi:hypothetical protein
MKKKQVFIFFIIGFLLICLSSSNAIDVSPPQGIQAITLNLSVGWNLISCPGDPVISDIPTLVAGKVIFPYGKYYNTVTALYENRTTMEYGKAYWLGVGVATQLTIRFSPALL